MDRITELRIENVRAIQSAVIRLGRPVTVLVGESGSCKSTVLACLEALRRAGHDALPDGSLMRYGAQDMTLGVTVEDDAGAAPPIRYRYTLAAGAVGYHQVGDLILPRLRSTVVSAEVARLVRVLRGIEVRVGLDVRGGALARSWRAERGVLDLVRLGLGDDVEEVCVEPFGVRFRGVPGLVRADELSDGQRAWLSVVSAARRGRTLLAVDGPERGLDGALLGRAVSLLANLGVPVVLATHADRVLEVVEDPVDAVRVCRRVGGAATVAELDGEELARWSRAYGGLGELRAAGWLGRVVAGGPGAASR